MSHSNQKQVLQGSVNHFGPRMPETHLPTENGKLERVIVQPLVAMSGVATLTPEPLAGDTANMIPAHSLITHAYMFVMEDFDGANTSTTVTVGITGNTNGLFNLTVNDLDNNEGEWFVSPVGAEDAVGASVGAAPVSIVGAFGSAHANNDGRAIVVVKYLPPPVHVASEGAIDA